MEWPEENDVFERINEIEECLNGLLIYVAAKEAGISPDWNDPAFQEFLKQNPSRPKEGRLFRKGAGPHAVAADGFHARATISRIAEYVKLLKENIKN